MNPRPSEVERELGLRPDDVEAELYPSVAEVEAERYPTLPASRPSPFRDLRGADG